MSNNIHTDPTKRHDFVLLFDVENGNPNGDPDAGNLPRIDPETMHGIITDVCLKRKVRDYLQITKSIPIFIQSETALNTIINNAAKELGIDLSICVLDDEEVIEWFQSNNPDPDNFVIDGNELTYSGDKKDLKKMFADLDIDKNFKKKLDNIVKQFSGKKTLSTEERGRTKEKLIKDYYDIRMFGAVLSTGINAGQVRGPVQFTFAKSVDPIIRLDNAITRKAVTKEEDKKRKETEMARKPTVPYALYMAHGFYNPYFALRPKINKGDPDECMVSKDDLENLWEALEWMFNNDTAAARGKMTTRGLYVFTHERKRGDAPSHKLFKLIDIPPIGGSPRSFSEYENKIPKLETGKLDAVGFKGVFLTKLV